jgi:hypothetical protein
VGDVVWILGGVFLMLLAAALLVVLVLDVRCYPWWSPGRSMYEWTRSERNKKYKSREDVI